MCPNFLNVRYTSFYICFLQILFFKLKMLVQPHDPISLTF